MFPLMRDTNPKQWIESCGSIREGGLLEPIVTHEGMVLDGRNRFLACLETNKPPRFVEFGSLGLGIDPHMYAFDRNFQRRDLNEDQRTAIYAAFFKVHQQQALARRQKNLKRGTKIS